MNAVKRAAKVVLTSTMVMLGLGALEKAHALLNPDTMLVSVTPTVTYAVAITSGSSSGGYQFGNVALSATTQSTTAITLSNTGNVPEYFSMAISNSTGSWNATTGAPGTDTFRMIAELAANQPAVAAGFNTADALSNPPVPATAASLYANGGSQTKTNASSTAKLWLRLEMPTALSSGLSTPEIFTLTVNGQGS